MRFSVIIPALNEARIVSRCIAHVRSLNPEAEIIVADGGSLDNTVAIARKAGICTVASGQGRGIQCNAGAALASGDVLVFLHTDTELPADAFKQLEEYFINDSVQIGTFRLSFDFNHWLLKLYCLPCELNIAFTRFGDQCIVVRKSFFGSIGGFPNWRLFEDLTLINKARRKTRIYRFPGKIQTSARRFLRNGILRQQLLNIWLIILYFLGISPDKLARKYEQTTYNWHKFSLVVFTRYPRLGKVKTRLAQSLGDEQATELYRLCAEQVFHVCEKFSQKARLYVSFDNAEDVAKGAVWVGPRFDSVAQIKGDLGQRLEHAISTTLN
ncbi:TIGR04283 family arsenosugar biosynthesis glycosyltransferase [Chloroflexota bacterium]